MIAILFQTHFPLSSLIFIFYFFDRLEMGLSIKFTGSVALLGFVVLLLLRGSTADTPHEGLHKEVYIRAFSHLQLGEMFNYKIIYFHLSFHQNSLYQNRHH